MFHKKPLPRLKTCVSALRFALFAFVAFGITAEGVLANASENHYLTISGKSVDNLNPETRPSVCVAFLGQSVTHGSVRVATFTGSISEDTLTVHAITTANGQIEIGDRILGGAESNFNGARIIDQINGSKMAAGTYRLDRTIGVIGPQAMTAAFPQAFHSVRNPALAAPLFGAVNPSGGALFRLYDRMYDWGYYFKIINAAKGSMSLVQHGAGQMAFRTNGGSGYFSRRPPVGSSGDRGFAGTRVSPTNGPVWVATKGRRIAAMGSRSEHPIGPNPAMLDYIFTPPPDLTTAMHMPPGFDIYRPDATITDGGIVWAAEAQNVNSYGGSSGTVFSEKQAGIGWDPLGIIQTAYDELMTLGGCATRWVYIDGNQADLQDGSVTAQSWRTRAVVNVAEFFLRRNVKVMIGNMIFSPGSGNIAVHMAENKANLAAYNTLKASDHGGNVFWGADLYAELGTKLDDEGKMLPDRIHLNGRGSMDQGDAYAAAFEAILPFRAWPRGGRKPYRSH